MKKSGDHVESECGGVNNTGKVLSYARNSENSQNSKNTGRCGHNAKIIAFFWVSKGAIPLYSHT